MAWHFGLTDLSGVAIGEIQNASERTWHKPLNGLDTASFKIRLDNPLVDEIVNPSGREPGDLLLKIYQGSTLRFCGEVMTVEEVGDDSGETLAITASGALWRLQKRLVGVGAAVNEILTGTYAAIVTSIINQANTDHETGIQLGTLSASLYTTTVGPWNYKPIAEVLTETQASKVPAPFDNLYLPYAVDDFPGSGTVGGSTDQASPSNTWTVTGAGNNFTRGIDGGSGCVHTGSPIARAISSAAAHDNTISGIDFFTAIANGEGAIPGIIGRYKDDNNYLQCYYNWDAALIAVIKIIGGTPTVIATSGTGVPQVLTGYRMRLFLDDLGNIAVWHYTASSGYMGSPHIVTQDSALAAGGALSTASGAGKTGFFHNTTTASNMVIHNFEASTYITPQAFDFELDPIEPTGTPPKIATLNVVPQIGTVKSDVIFEFGFGARTSNQYRRLIDRQGMVTYAYSLPSGYPDSSTDVRAATDATAVAARGLLQEVIPSDVDDSQLRQALVQAHIAVRKIPRQIITFEPSVNAPTYGSGTGQYLVGDFVTGRGMVNNSSRFNALFRVYAVDLTIDEEGKETLVPTLVPE